MGDWLAIILIVGVYVAIAAGIGRRLFDPPISWLRGILCSVLVFFGALPLLYWTLEQIDVVSGADIHLDNLAELAYFVVAIAWMVAISLIVMVTLELLWPTRPRRNPLTVVRDWIRRRDRARRYAQILRIASRHGLGAYRHRHSGLAELSSSLVAAMNEAGVTFVKAGQVLSARDDVLPHELTSALATLQTDSSALPWERVSAAIEEQLGRPLDEVFAEIDPEPLAAASVAQVHTARLHSGDEVVVKIQRPEARAQVTTDLDIIGRLAIDAERMDWGRDFGVRALVTEFSRALREELDYRIEVSNTQMLRDTIASTGTELIRVPRVYPEWCTAQLIVQERAVGTPFSRLTGDEVDDAVATEIADGILESVFTQIAVAGVFHADLHAGNLILAPDGTVTMIDFGSVGIIEKSLRRLLLPLLIAASNEDDVTATDAVLLIVDTPPGGIDERALQHDVGINLTRVLHSGADENLFRALLDVMRRHHLGVPPSLLLAFRTLGSLEGTLRTLAPDYDMIGRALEIAPRIALKTHGLKSTALTAQATAGITLERLRRAPRRIDSLTRKLDEGSLAVRLKAMDTVGDRSWVGGMLSQFLTTVIGISLIAIGVVFGFIVDGPLLTEGVGVFPFLGSVIGLAGLLLVLRTVRIAFRPSGRDRAAP